jgi:TetR/AcrR family transcriptional regulator
MAKTRATDYDDKRRSILGPSARLFATHGYDRASMNMVAAACGVSKALLYHYYKDKETLLFDIIRIHLEELLAAVEAVSAEADAEPRARLRAMAGALLEAYREADAEHKVQINNLPLLPSERQEVIKAMERELVARFADAIAACVPGLAQSRHLLKPVTMSLFGMLNWHYLWFREGGPLSRADYADLAVRLLLEGVGGLGAPITTPAAAGPRSSPRREPAPLARPALSGT